MSHRPSLSYSASPRASPFRRPESPASPSPLRQSTSNPSVARPAATSISLGQEVPSIMPAEIRTPRQRDAFPPASPGFGGVLASAKSSTADSSAWSKLQPAQVRELREGFQTLDRDSDGLVVREDVLDMFAQLGISPTSTELASFFPAGSPATLSLPAYMNSIASLLASLSPSSELVSAFSAFDEDENGQADLVELRTSLLHTAPEPGEKALSERQVDQVLNAFTAKRAFGKQTGLGKGKRGDVFKYQDFVAGIMGGSDPRSERNSED